MMVLLDGGRSGKAGSLCKRFLKAFTLLFISVCKMWVRIRHKCRGLQLGASCCNRHHDRCPRDVYGGVPISRGSEPTLDALEMRLTLAVRFLAMPALVARTRSIPRVDRLQRDPCKSGFIRKV